MLHLSEACGTFGSLELLVRSSCRFCDDRSEASVGCFGLICRVSSGSFSYVRISRSDLPVLKFYAFLSTLGVLRSFGSTGPLRGGGWTYRILQLRLGGELFMSSRESFGRSLVRGVCLSNSSFSCMTGESR